MFEYLPSVSDNDTENNEVSDVSENRQCQPDFDSSYFIGPSCSDNQMPGNFVDSDAGSFNLPVDQEKQDLKSVPIHIILNTFMCLLNRPNRPLGIILKQRRFLQCFAATNLSSSISLFQIEGLLFPLIFFKQISDGTISGAIPFYLYGSEKQCSNFGFAGLLEQFRSRLTNITLATSSNHRYIQYITDCLIKLQLRGKHTDIFFKRGIQSLKLYGEDSKGFNKVNYMLNDTDKCVRQLAAALARDSVSLFLTLTCNQRRHPGVAP